MRHAAADLDPSGERDLVERARCGDPDAWEALYRRSRPRLTAYARRRLAAPEQVDEAVSETMVRAMVGIARYRPGRLGIEAWLLGIARNVVLETYRSGGRQRPADPMDLAGRSVAGQADPETTVIEAEERVLVAQAFDRLSPQDRDLLGLRVLAGLDAARVGQLTGRRPGAVRMAQSRALARLREEYHDLSA